MKHIRMSEGIFSIATGFGYAHILKGSTVWMTFLGPMAKSRALNRLWLIQPWGHFDRDSTAN